MTRRLVLAAIAVAGLLSLAVTYGAPLNGPVIRSDGLGYYLYLPAAFIDHDMTLRATVRRSFGGQPPEEQGVNHVDGSTRLLIKYPLGEALLLAPWFLSAHAVATATHVWPADGFSTPYQAAVALGGLAYLVLGLWVLGRWLDRFFDAAVVNWTLCALALGTNLFHYGTYDNTFSHVYAFFAAALCLSRIPRWYEQPSTRRTLALAGGAALVTLVRPTDTILLLFAPLCGVVSVATASTRLRWLRAHLEDVVLGSLVYLALVGLQLLYWKHVTDHWIVFSYTGERFDFAHPEVTNVLFSIRKGLFFWSPLLLLATIGFAWTAARARDYLLPSLLVLPLSVFIVASWYDWAYGGSFGHRAFVEMLPVFAIGLASLMQKAWSTRWRVPLLGLISTLMLLSSFLMIRYWTHMLPYDHTNWNYFRRAFTSW